MTTFFRIQKFLHSPTINGLVSLYGVQIANYIFPLITFPFLVRTLGTSKWGSLLIVQSFAQFLTLFIEYGFNISATRDVAKNRQNLVKLAELLIGVIGAKVLLAIVGTAAALLVAFFMPSINGDPLLLSAGIFWGIASGASAIWYYQGLERLKFVVTIEIILKALSVGAILVIVSKPQDAWKVLCIQGLAALIASLIALKIAFKEVGFIIPKYSHVISALQLGWTMFIFRVTVSLYTIGNPLVLGQMVSPQLVGHYFGGERLVKVLLGFFDPIGRVFMPKLSFLIKNSIKDAAALSKKIILIMLSVGILLAVCLYYISPLIVNLFLGSQSKESILIIQTLVIIIPLIALSNAVGIQWMIPMNLDKPFNTIILVAGIINLILVFILVPIYSYIGMAYATIIVELLVTLSMCIYLLWIRKSPWQVTKGNTHEI